MAKAIARISKLNKENIGSSELHVNRDRYTPNANQEIDNIRFIGQEDNRKLDTIVRERIGEQTIRKNAVLAVEMLLSASPEYFRPNEPERAGYYEQEKLENWQGAVRDWLDEKYGDRIVRAELHLDESTPHIHAYFVPLDEKGKLNCRGIFGGRQKLSKFQDSYAGAMSHLGLERGIKGSRAKHTKIKEYYAAVNASDKELTNEEIKQQLADRNKAIAEKKQALATAASLSQKNESLQQRLEKAEQEIKMQKQEVKSWREKYTEIANNVRQTPLDEVAFELGLSRDPKDKHKWKNEAHTISITGNKFYDWKLMKGGGGAIDLVMSVNECNFKEAVVWLNDRFGTGQTVENVTYKIQEIVSTEPKPKFVAPPAAQNKWGAVKSYLTSQRKLPSGIVDELHESGLVYADEKRNAVFLRRSLDDQEINGASLRGTAGINNTFKGLSRGSNRGKGWFYFEKGEQSEDSIKRVVLAESPIDALSLSVMERTESKRTMYLSTDGAGEVPLSYLRNMDEIVIAFDNDQPGKVMANNLRSEIPEAKIKTPRGIDWNEDLINMLNWSDTGNQQRNENLRERKSEDKGFSI